MDGSVRTDRTRRGARKLLLIAVLAAVVIAGTATVASAAEGFFVERSLISAPATQAAAAVTGSRAVFEDYRNGNWDIYVVDLVSGKVEQITTTTSDQRSPVLSGELVAYLDYTRDPAKPDVYVYRLYSKTSSRLTIDPAARESLAIDGTRIVWQDKRGGDWDIYAYDFDGETEAKITSSTADQTSPSISGERMVWTDDRDGNKDIRAYDFASKLETRLTTNASDQYDAEISGGRVAFVDERNGNQDIYLYDLGAKKESRVTFDPTDQREPSLSGNKLVWTDFRNGDEDVYLYDLGAAEGSRLTGDGRQFAPNIDGPFVVFGTDANNGDLRLLELLAPKVTWGYTGLPYGYRYTDYYSRPRYNYPANLFGALTTATGTGLAGYTLRVESSPDGVTWSPIGTVVTESADRYLWGYYPFGGFNYQTPRLTTRTFFRVVFPGNSTYLSAESNAWVVRPQAYVGRPSGPSSSIARSAAFTSVTVIKPKITGASNAVLYCYHYEGGRWRYIKYVRLGTRAYTDTASKLVARVRLPKSGRWRIRTSFQGNDYNSYASGPYRYVTVR